MSVPAHCTVFWAGLSLDSAGLDTLLLPAERDRAHRFAKPADRSRSRLAAALVRAAAARHTGLAPQQVVIDRACPDCDRPHGKPAVTGSDLQVSVSHTGDWVVLATSLDAPLGVDVEPVARRPVGAALLDATLAATERAALPPGDPTAWFVQRWTLKEAVVKATGAGLRVPLREVVVTDGRVTDYPGGLLAAAVPLAAPAGHVAALAALASDVVVSTGEADELLAGQPTGASDTGDESVSEPDEQRG